jgi:hypothetical protein
LLLFKKNDIDRYFLKKTALFFHLTLLLLAVITFLEFINRTELIIIIRESLPFILGLGIILFLASNKDEERIRVLERTFYFIGLFFLIQFILSAYESLLNIYFVKEFNWALHDMYSSSVGRRFILNIFNIDTSFLDVFYHPFSGILGQHNYWAYQLPFYNLIFLIMYHNTKGRYYFFLLVMVFLAILLNTTRAGIIAIAITDLFYILFLRKKNGSKNYTVILLAIIIAAYYFTNISLNILGYFQKTDTITIRVDWYSVFLKHIFSGDFPFISGYGNSGLVSVMHKLRAYNFESAFFQIFYTHGLIAFSIFMALLIGIVLQGRNFSQLNKYFSYLLVFNIIGVSLTIGGILNYFTFQFVTIIYVYIAITDPSYKKTALFNTISEPMHQNYELNPVVLKE